MNAKEKELAKTKEDIKETQTSTEKHNSRACELSSSKSTGKAKMYVCMHVKYFV